MPGFSMPLYDNSLPRDRRIAGMSTAVFTGSHIAERIAQGEPDEAIVFEAMRNVTVQDQDIWAHETAWFRDELLEWIEALRAVQVLRTDDSAGQAFSLLRGRGVTRGDAAGAVLGLLGRHVALPKDEELGIVQPRPPPLGMNPRESEALARMRGCQPGVRYLWLGPGELRIFDTKRGAAEDLRVGACLEFGRVDRANLVTAPWRMSLLPVDIPYRNLERYKTHHALAALEDFAQTHLLVPASTAVPVMQIAEPDRSMPPGRRARLARSLRMTAFDGSYRELRAGTPVTVVGSSVDYVALEANGERGYAGAESGRQSIDGPPEESPGRAFAGAILGLAGDFVGLVAKQSSAPPAGEQRIDKDGYVYECNAVGGWRRKSGFFGDERRVNGFGQPKIKQSLLGQARGREPFGGQSETSDGKPLFEIDE